MTTNIRSLRRRPIAGTLFVSEDDLAAYPVRSLWNGWNFYPDVLLSPKTCENRDKSTVRSVQIGAYSNFAFGSTERTPHGCGTYMLTLLLPETPRQYLIELPEIFSAYRFYIDDELVLSAGETNDEQYRSRLQNRAVSFEGSGTVRLLLAVRDESWIYSGMTYPPAFGTALGVNTQRAVRVCISAAMLTLMLLFASFALWLCLGSMRCPAQFTAVSAAESERGSAAVRSGRSCAEGAAGAALVRHRAGQRLPDHAADRSAAWTYLCAAECRAQGGGAGLCRHMWCGAAVRCVCRAPVRMEYPRIFRFDGAVSAGGDSLSARLGSLCGAPTGMARRSAVLRGYFLRHAVFVGLPAACLRADSRQMVL